MLEKQFDVILIGSGPSALGAEKAISESGLKYCVIDVGLEVPMEMTDHNTLKKIAYDLHDVNEKTIFGFRSPRSSISIDTIGTEVASSEMRGGYGNLWGAVCERLTKDELSQLGIEITDTDVFYDSVADLINARQRDVEFSSSLVKKIIENDKLSKFWKLPFLAYDRTKCVGCGLCFYGCTSNAITNFRTDITSSPGSKKKIHGKVSHFESFPQCVRVYYNDLISNDECYITGKMLFIGAGPVETSKIIARSMKGCTRFILRDSAYFIYPFLTYRTEKAKNTLCELEGRAIFNGLNVKFQLYTNSEYIKNQALKTLNLPRMISGWLGPIFCRLGILQVFYDSECSPHAEFKLDRCTNKFYQTARFPKMKLPGVWFFSFLQLIYNGILLLPLAKKTSVLVGRHYGAASFFIKDKRLEANSLDGTLENCPNVHMIDASVFKKIMAFSPTETIVANAYRIAKEALK